MKPKSSLQYFLRQKAKAEEAGPQIDWESRRQKWQCHVARLYDMVRGWLAPLEAKGILRFQATPYSLEEDYVGQYEIDILHILVGKQKVSFYPKGTVIAGAEGRIDVRGQKSSKMLVLRENSWFIVDKLTKVQLYPFNEDSFQGVLEEVME